MVGCATIVFGFVATGGQPDGLALLRAWLVVMCGHAAIGLANDYVDRNRDALTRNTRIQELHDLITKDSAFAGTEKGPS